MVKVYANSTISDLRTRCKASGSGSQAKKYINLAGSSSDDARLDELIVDLEAAGLQGHKVPGPLIRASVGGSSRTLKLVPLALSSGMKEVKSLLTEAYEDLNPEKTEGGQRIAKDKDLDLAPGADAKWSSHSLRRLADTTATFYQALTGITEAQIDIYFGWHERVLLKAMQRHYASLSIRQRMALAKITGMM